MTENTGMKSYVKGVAFLTLAMLFVKILSMVYRIPFQNLVGDEGFYIYQQVYPFVAFFVTWTASGIAIAISKILSESRWHQRELVGMLWKYLIGIAIVLFIVLYSTAPFYAEIMGDEKLVPLLQIGSFITLTIPFLAMYKGVAQRIGDFQTLALSQVFEQLIRVAIILCGAWVLIRLNASLYRVGEMATFGTVIGEVAGVLLLIGVIHRRQKLSFRWQTSIPFKEQLHIMKRLCIYSVGISLSSLLLILFQLVDAFTILNALQQHGLPKLESMVTKGIYDRGQPLVQVGLVLASSLAMAIVPLITLEMKRKRFKEAQKYMHLTYRVSLLIGVAATAGLIVVMPMLNEAMFKTPALSNVLSLFVLQIVWLSLIMPIVAILQGLGYTKYPSLLLICSLIVKLLCNHIFVATFGITGAAIASNVGLAVTAIGLIFFLKKVTGVRLGAKAFWKGLIVATCSMLIGVVIWQMLTTSAFEYVFHSHRIVALTEAVTSICIGVIIFLMVATKMAVLSVRDWFVLPFGKKVAAFQLYINRNKK